MSELAKRDENGEKGEKLTQSILLSRFWVLKRSADVDGADFLVQRHCNSLKELRSRAREIQILGIVQSKYFEKNNKVKVQRAYVLDNDRPRKEFFCSLHTHDDEGEPAHYFFSAADIVNEFEVTCDEFFWFALTKERQYTEYKNPKVRFVVDKIESGVNQAEGEANKSFFRKKFQVFAIPTKHLQKEPNFFYKLAIVNGVRVATVTDVKTNHSRLLEQRRDLYANQGDFYWGDDDIGCQFLAVSILAHHFDGDLPHDAPVPALRQWLQDLDSDSPHVLKSQMLHDLCKTAQEQPDFLQRLEEEYPMDFSPGNTAFFEVMAKLGTTLTIRSADGTESVIETSGYSEALLHKLNAVKIFLPGIERSAEPIKQALALRLVVERDATTGKVLRILDSLSLHKVH